MDKDKGLHLQHIFLCKPKILVLNEPNANLDRSGEHVLKDIVIAAKQNDVGILPISHMPAVLSIADEIMIFKHGSVVEYENADDVLSKMMPNQFSISFIWLYIMFSSKINA